jgi:hypothetical protein
MVFGNPYWLSRSEILMQNSFGRLKALNCIVFIQINILQNRPNYDSDKFPDDELMTICD